VRNIWTYFKKSHDVIRLVYGLLRATPWWDHVSIAIEMKKAKNAHDLMNDDFSKKYLTTVT
jgi:hypothetical protein